MKKPQRNLYILSCVFMCLSVSAYGQVSLPYVPGESGSLAQVPTETPTPTATNTQFIAPTVTVTNTLVLPTATHTNTVAAHTATHTATSTLTASGHTVTPKATSTLPAVEPTSTPSGLRPVVVVKKYNINPGDPRAGQDFRLKAFLQNEGQLKARNIIVTFEAGELLPLDTGGVQAIGELKHGDGESFTQKFTVSRAVQTTGAITLKANVSYTDENGASYTEAFSFTVNVIGVGSGGAAATKTPIPGDGPQLIIKSYQSSVERLKPGDQFDLQLQIVNNGNQEAKSVSIVAGGATVSTSSSEKEQGSASISGGDFSHFSPIGVSNVQSLGTIKAGENLSISQPLIVNTSNDAGAYSFKISFVYTNIKGEIVSSDQVITLLVYSPPTIEINFYRKPDELVEGQAGKLPLQIVNLGRKAIVLGKVLVNAENASFENNTATIGSIDVGSFYTLDASITPGESGSQSLSIIVEYTDAFNQIQVLERTIQIEVQARTNEGVAEGDQGQFDFSTDTREPETFLQKVLRFLKGLIGLDSSPPTEKNPEPIQSP